MQSQTTIMRAVIDVELKRQFMSALAREGQTFSSWLRTSMTQYLDDREGEIAHATAIPLRGKDRAD